ncbi:MAG: acetyltransferase [Acidimicrobiales bacterium]
MRLVIVGAGGHGREVLDIVEALREQHDVPEFAGFVADTVPAPELLERRDAPHIGALDLLEELDVAYTLGIGDGSTRRALDERLTGWNRTAITLVHPAATIGSDVELSPGVQLAAGARVTTNVRLGRHVHLNVNAVVSHDCRVGRYSTLSPGVHLNGSVTVGREVFFGTGAIVTPGITIGDGARIGAGAVVLDDIPGGVTAVGAPASW